VSEYASALYFGLVAHRRLRPRPHALRYRVFQMLFDLDELPALDRRLRLFSRNRFNLFGFYDRDHGEGGPDLRAHVVGLLAQAGIDLRGGKIRLLCNPRILGYVFNPLSVYFCHRGDGGLAAMLYEVNNTFGERHSYLIPVAGGSGPVVEQSCAKEFYVSPFIGMDATYHFRVAAPAETAAIVIRQDDDQGTLLHASFAGRRVSLSDAALARAFLRYPLLTLKVIGGIHWEAFKLWRKGVALVPHPAAPENPVTVVPPRNQFEGENYDAA